MSSDLPEPDAIGFDSPGDRRQQQNPIRWSWGAGQFTVQADASGLVDLFYDFEGRLGEIHLDTLHPTAVGELAAALQAAAAQATSAWQQQNDEPRKG